MISNLMRLARSFFAEIPRPSRFRTIDGITAWVAGAILLLVSVHLVQVASIHATSKQVTSGFTTTVPEMIERGARTTLTRGNGWFAYGLAYFRAAYVVRQFDTRGNSASALEASDPTFGQMRVHFSLITVSLLAILGISFLLAFAIRDNWPMRLLAAATFLLLFRLNYLWTGYVFNPHPEVMLSFVTALALYLTWHSGEKPESLGWFIAAALAWGAAVSTKVTALVFLPFLVFVWLPPFSRARLGKAAVFLGMTFVGYLVVGFPQNFQIARKVFLLADHQTRFVRGFDPSGTYSWWQGLVAESWPFAAAVVLFVLIYSGTHSHKRPEQALGRAWRIFAIPLGAFFVFSLFRNVGPARHYLFPFESTLLVGGALLAMEVAAARPRIWLRILAPYLKVGALLLGIGLLAVIHNDHNSRLASGTARKQLCTGPAKEFYARVDSLLKSGRKAIITPYTPFYEPGRQNVIRTFRLNINHVAPGKATVFALSKKYFRRYATSGGVSEYVRATTANLEGAQKFYRRFYKRKVMVAYGQTWKKTYDFPRCGWEIWTVN